MPAIPPHSSATTDVAWDARAQESKLTMPVSGTAARSFYGWRDAKGADLDGDGWPDAKADYKFPHHMVGDNGIGGAANARACSTGIAVLNGGRGGSPIPSADRQGVWNHLSRHLQAAGQKPPPLNASLAETLVWAVTEAGMEAEEAREHAAAAEERHEFPLAEATPLLPPALAHGIWAMERDTIMQVLDTAAQFASQREPLRAMEEQLRAMESVRSSTLGFDAYNDNGIDVAGNGVAVIPLSGLITPRASILSLIFGGGGGLEGFRCALREAVASSDVKKIVLDIDSPGGLVSLVPETAAELRKARETKPVVACVNSLAASAAYWIASQATEVVCTPSGLAGSIGVYKVHVDRSGLNERMGVKPTYISAGRFKTEGNPDAALSDQAEAHFQQDIDDVYGMFVEAVAEGRGTTPQAVVNGYGEGRCLIAQRASEANLVDRIGTIADVVGAAVEDERPEDGDDDLEDPVEDPEARIERRRERARLLLG